MSVEEENLRGKTVMRGTNRSKESIVLSVDQFLIRREIEAVEGSIGGIFDVCTETM